MKNVLSQFVGIAALFTLASGSAFAHIDYSESGSLHWIEHNAASPAAPGARAQAPYGYQASGPAARVIELDGSARGINVMRLETVELRLGDQRITWTFDTLGAPSFPLTAVWPAAEGVTVYVDESPLYRN